MSELLSLEARIVATLRGIYDPEIPVNIYDLGLIYNLDCRDDGHVTVTMTLTAPSCPMAEDLVENVRAAVAQIDGVREAEVRLVFEPEWNKDMISEEALLQLDMM